MCEKIPTNLPADFEARMKAELGSEYEAFAAALMKGAEPAIRINTLKCSAQDITRITGWSLTPVPWANDGCYVDDPAARPGKSPLHAAGAYYIQEPSAMSVAAKADAKPFETVLDLCAAPGGKATALAASMRGQGLLIANEPVTKRAEILSENVERMGLANVIVTNEYPAKLAERFPGYFNKIIVDAPCSGEGMFGKEPEAIPAWSPDLVAANADRQREILEAADKMLLPGGRLIYSTCTFARKEDEEQLQSFLERHRDYTMLSEEKFYPHKVRGLGHYVGVLEKELPADRPAKRQHTKLNADHGQVLAWNHFRAEVLTGGIPALDTDDFNSRLISFGSNLYLLPKEIDTGKIRICRAGLQLGSLERDRFIPAHALALFLKPEQAAQSFDLTLEQAEGYIHGNTISCPAQLKGWVLVTVCGISLAWGKASGGVIKNHYPKGLRR